MQDVTQKNHILFPSIDFLPNKNETSSAGQMTTNVLDHLYVDPRGLVH